MIYDTNGNPILDAAFSLESGEVKLFSIKIDCLTGFSLRSAPVADVLLEARQIGVVPYTNLETSQIDLGTWDGTEQTFEVRLTADTISAPLRRLVRLAVGRPVSPITPFDFTATTQDANSILTEWSRPDDTTTVSGFEIRINCPAMAITDLVVDVGYVFENLTVGINPSTQVFFEIRSYNISGTRSSYSAQISATTTA